MGAVAGAIASGRVPAGGEAGDPWTSWVNPTSIVGGVLAVTVGAYLAAVYLIWDARRLADDPMVEYFRQRAVVVAVVAGVVAFVGIFVLRADARYVFDGLTSRALPLVLLSVVCGIGSLGLLLRRSPRGARVLAAGAVASIVWAWGVAQWPYILPDEPEGVGGRGAVGDAGDPAGGVRRRRGRHRAVARAALRARPAEPAAGGGRGLPSGRRRVDARLLTNLHQWWDRHAG